MNVQGMGAAFGAMSGQFRSYQIQNRGQEGDPEEMAAGMAEKLLDKLDVNGDGVISAEELDDDQLSSADTDGDGQITLEELEEEALAKINEGAFAKSGEMGGFLGRMQMLMQDENSESLASQMANRILEEFDVDGDGALSADEFDETVISRADTDGDGLASLDELEADAQNVIAEGPPPPPPGGMGGPGGMASDSEDDEDEEEDLIDILTSQLYSALDTDGDGVVSADELEDDRLAVADADEDGTVTLEELEAVMQSRDGAGPPPFTSSMEGLTPGDFKMTRANDAYTSQLQGWFNSMGAGSNFGNEAAGGVNLFA